MRPCKIRLSCAALQHNFALIKGHAPQSRIWAVVKANAYGHGLRFAAEALADRADGFAVACLEEAESLSALGLAQPILLLEGLFSWQEAHVARSLQLELVIHRYDQLQWLVECDADYPWRLWIKLDTGMHRLGFAWSDSEALVQRLRKLLPRAQVHALSHLACADEQHDTFTAIQIERFERATASWAAQRSLANTAGLIRYPNSHYDWVRPGIGLYGATELLRGQRAVMHLVSEVISVKQVAVGEGVGYGLDWVAKRPSVLAVVAAGYGDGYPRHAVSGTPVWLAGAAAPIVGRVSMDMLCVDITDHPARDGIQPGTPVELWGDRVPVTQVAQQAGTIAYELLCGITERVHREEG